MYSLGLLRLDWRKKKVESPPSKNLKTGIHTGKFGMVKITRNHVTGKINVVGWILSPVTEKQMRIERSFVQTTDANLYSDYVRDGSKVLNQNALQAGRLFRQVKDVTAEYKVQKNENGYLVYDEKILLGSIVKDDSTDIGESWLVFDTAGTEIGQAMSKHHALSTIAIHYINLI